MLLIIALNIATGWILWSLSHYLGHRVMHQLIETGHIQGLAYGEKCHHDDWGTRPAADNARKWCQGFPLLYMLFGVMAVTLVWFFIFGMVASISFGISAVTCAVFDFYVHDNITLQSQHRPWLKKLQKLHDTHHETPVTQNYSIATGLIWDRIFNTFSKD